MPLVNGSGNDISNLAAQLSPRQRAALLQLLLAAPKSARRQDHACLDACERLLWSRIKADSAAPGRIWLTYMLLRYGGMRLKEIRNLTEEDCAFAEGRVSASGRLVLFGPQIAARLAKFWAEWPGRNQRLPFACDPSLIRRTLAQIGRSCGCQGLNARYLRKNREMELANGGLHPGLVAWFMTGRESPLNPGETESTIRYYLSRENMMKTSARNVFSGKVAEIAENGILTSVTMRTGDGLEITAIITNTSRRNLDLETGSPVTALVKAPWVSITPLGERAEASPPNCCQGTVEAINRDSLACEIDVNLSQGGRICALYANGAWPANGIEKGSQVIASFSPFAVILTGN